MSIHGIRDSLDSLTRSNRDNIGGKDATKPKIGFKVFVALLFLVSSEAIIVELQVLRLSQNGQKMLFTLPSTAHLNTGQFVAWFCCCCCECFDR